MPCPLSALSSNRRRPVGKPPVRALFICLRRRSPRRPFPALQPRAVFPAPAAFAAPLVAKADASKDNSGNGATATSSVMQPVISGSNFNVGEGIPHVTSGEMIVDTTKAVQIVTYAWFDGSSLYNGNANTGVYKISLEFSLVS